jgi:hypothetical protein
MQRRRGDRGVRVPSVLGLRGERARVHAVDAVARGDAVPYELDLARVRRRRDVGAGDGDAAGGKGHRARVRLGDLVDLDGVRAGLECARGDGEGRAGGLLVLRDVSAVDGDGERVLAGDGKGEGGLGAREGEPEARVRPGERVRVVRVGEHASDQLDLGGGGRRWGR